MREGAKDPQAEQPGQVSSPTGAAGWWWRPRLFGEPAATDVLSSIAAPLLAGFSITLLGVVAQAPGSFRWPGVAMLLLMATATLFVMSLQSGFWARQYVASKDEAASWFIDFDNPVRQEQVRREQVAFAKAYEGWAARAKLLYRFGLLALFASLLVVLLPARSGDGAIQSGWRWAGCALALAVLTFETVWILSYRLLQLRLVQRIPVLNRALRSLLVPAMRNVNRGG